MSTPENPLHGAEIISQLIKQIERIEENTIGGYQARFDAVYTALNELADYIYNEDMILRFDDKTVNNIESAMGLMKKMQKWINANYVEAQDKKDVVEE